jgi:hypothetical protein
VCCKSLTESFLYLSLCATCVAARVSKNWGGIYRELCVCVCVSILREVCSFNFRTTEVRVSQLVRKNGVEFIVCVCVSLFRYHTNFHTK